MMEFIGGMVCKDELAAFRCQIARKHLPDLDSSVLKEVSELHHRGVQPREVGADKDDVIGRRGKPRHDGSGQESYATTAAGDE